MKQIKKIINRFLTEFFSVRISRVIVNEADEFKSRIFDQVKLVESKLGYYSVEPMPPEEDLALYYKKLYWSSVGGRKFIIRPRDLQHFYMIKNYCPEIFQRGRVVMNFGAGHGGFSHIAWMMGSSVLNLEPSGLQKYYETRWQSLLDFSQVKDSSVDFFYSSHSLEHVQSLNSFENNLRRILRPGATLFFEVPNSTVTLGLNGLPVVQPPHTYYFTPNFFENFFESIVSLNCYSYNENKDPIENWDDLEDPQGSVIRVIGKINV